LFLISFEKKLSFFLSYNFRKIIDHENNSGWIHISQLSEARVERVEDVVRLGDDVTVRVREIDSRGRINLTLRGVGQNSGMSYPEPTPTPVAPLN